MYSNADCTVYIYSEKEYIRVPITGVFWEESRKGDDGVTAKIFIPLPKLDIGMVMDKERNYVVRGIVEDRVWDTNTLRKFLNKHPLTITSIKKRDFGSHRMQHWEMEAE